MRPVKENFDRPLDGEPLGQPSVRLPALFLFVDLLLNMERLFVRPDLVDFFSIEFDCCLEPLLRRVGRERHTAGLLVKSAQRFESSALDNIVTATIRRQHAGIGFRW